MYTSDINPLSYGGHALALPDDERQEEWRRQRNELGFDDTESWSLDWTLYKLILPRLKYFYTNYMHKCIWNDAERITDTEFIISWLEDITSDTYSFPTIGIEETRRMNKALNLLFKYLPTYWS